MTRSSIKKYVFFSAKVGVTAALIWLVLRNVDIADTLRRVEAIPLWVIPASLALLFLQVVFGTLRWRIILRQFGEELPFSTAARLFFEGQFFNQALHSSGDVVKAEASQFAAKALDVGVFPQTCFVDHL